MAEFKLVLGFKEGICVQKDVKDKDASALVGKKIGDKLDGSSMGLEGYEFEITGGSDIAGFPMRKDVSGTLRKMILAVEGVGVHKQAKGIRQRKRVAGNTVHAQTIQINLKVLKVGKEDLLAEAKKKIAEKQPKPEAAKAEEPKVEEKKQEEKKPDGNKTAEPEEKKAEGKKAEAPKKESAAKGK